MWTKTGEQGTGWLYDTANVGHKRNFHVQFTATKGLGSQGDIALDDITFSNCAVGPSKNLTITEMASNATVGLDVDITIDFKYDGAPLGSVEWMKDNSPLPASDRYSVGMDGKS